VFLGEVNYSRFASRENAFCNLEFWPNAPPRTPRSFGHGLWVIRAATGRAAVVSGQYLQPEQSRLAEVLARKACETEASAGYNPELGGSMDIIKALEDRASALRIELGKIHEAIRALGGTTKIARSTGKRKFRHTVATKRKLRLAQQKIWAAKRKK
jgi:hypothetical protein